MLLLLCALKSHSTGLDVEERVDLCGSSVSYVQSKVYLIFNSHIKAFKRSRQLFIPALDLVDITLLTSQPPESRPRCSFSGECRDAIQSSMMIK
jgi:hypothetical protein